MDNLPFETESFEYAFEDEFRNRSPQSRARAPLPPRSQFAAPRSRPAQKVARQAPKNFGGTNFGKTMSRQAPPNPGQMAPGSWPGTGGSQPGMGGGPNRWRGKWPRLRPFMDSTVGSGGDSDLIRAIQEQLAALGFPAPATGVLGPATRRAVRLFQRSAGLPSTGSLDHRTVRALRSAAAGGPQASAPSFVDDGLSDAGPAAAAPDDAAPPADAAPADGDAPAAAPADSQGEVSTTAGGKPGCQCAGKCTHLEVDSVPLLASHKGKGGPDLAIVWNNLGSRPSQVDVVVHLHGHAKCRDGQDPRHLNLCQDIQPLSGLDFSDPTGKDPSAGRQRPTIALLPRGNYTGTNGGAGYNFPALRASGGLQTLIAFALAQVQQKLGVTGLSASRIILTAHSGGGHDLQEILRYTDPHEVHIFDGLYDLVDSSRGAKTPYVLSEWAAKRIARDLSAIASGRPVVPYMSADGGALRVVTLGTVRLSSAIGGTVRKMIPAGSPLAKWYRVDQTSEGHCTIPQRFGWQLLANSGADLKDLVRRRANSPVPKRRPAVPSAPKPEREEGTGTSITSPSFRAGGTSCSATENRLKPIVEPAKSDVATIAAKYATDTHKKILLERLAYAAYLKLKAAAEADGVPARILTIVSGYRSIAHQEVLWKRALAKYGSAKAARQWVAPPGHSPHHTGRAIDFYLGARNGSENVAKLRTLSPYRWLVCNARRFGFTPYAAEPWHWEFHPA
jgi:D-alanyl-D-alanine carboxypeptidase/Putative peptidoglycan binding domain